jgi:hypothetical protein
VILLVILSLLALFTLLGLTLVLATARAKANALAQARANPQAMRNDAALDEVINQVYRGTNDPDSVLQVHSLLEDLYGPPLLLGRVDGPPSPNTTAPTALANGQIINMNVVALAAPMPPSWELSSNAVNLANQGQAGIGASGEYCGLVITMINGRAQGRSSRIVGHVYNPATVTTTLQVMSFDGLVPNGPNAATNYLGDQFVINGRPFSGTGFGFNPAQPALNISAVPQAQLTLQDPLGAASGSTVPWYYALLPNPAAAPPVPPLLPGTSNYSAAALAGGANESYDVPDFQNMILALHFYDPTTNNVVTPLPSLHRPELVQYWMSAYATAALWVPPSGAGPLGPFTNQDWLDMVNTPPKGFSQLFPDLARRITLRPLAVDNYVDNNNNGVLDAGDTYFTGDNLTFDPILSSLPGGAFQWDVDNDGDGIPDSIWADVGLETQTAPDGTQYKLLAAILCVDMDGKINVNAHGTLTQLDPERYGSPINGPFAGNLGTVATGAVNAKQLTIGQGVGSWEINPLYLFMRNQALHGGAAPTPQNQALNDLWLMWQGFIDNPNPGVTLPIYYEGLNGESQRPGLYVPTNNPSAAGYTIWQYILAGPQPGVTRWYDAGTNLPHDPFSLARTIGIRPFMLQPQVSGGLANPGNFFDYVSPSYSALINPAAAPSLHVPTSYNSPYDLHARGVTGVDIAGFASFAGTPNLSWTAVQTDPANAGQPLSDVPDHPGELDLSQHAQHDGRFYPPAGGNPGVYASIDQPFGPDVLQHLLRVKDNDMLNSPSRLKHLADLSKLLPTSAPAWPLQDSQRWSVTTTSTHLPVHEPSAPDFTAVSAAGQDILAFSNTNPAFPLGPALRYNNKSIVDLMRARIYAENAANPSYQQINSADLALFGNVGTVWPLLAPELIEGLKLDINRLLGNGVDDNANGAVDDPFESLIAGGEQLLDPAAQYLPPGALGYVVQAFVDQNNDGLYPAFGGGTDATNSDFRARQLLAKQLYVLMMLLVDERTLKANIFNTTTPMNPPLLPPWPQFDLYTASSKEQAAYVIAQWAINAVDFRDADSIMTPFEFDLHPFTDDDLNVANGTWDVDDVVFPANGVVFPPNPVATPADDLNAWRGLVFGAERPALLIGETGAVHDRGTDDTNLATNLTMPPATMAGPDTYTNDPTNPDPDYDQVRRPRGSLVVELINPNGPMDAPRNDLLYDARLGAAQPWTANATGVNLGQAVVDPVTGNLSSVWRLAVVFSPLGYDAYTGIAPATVIVDPRVPALPVAVIHRVAYLGSGVTAANDYVAISGLDVPVNRSFYVDSTITGGMPLIIPPDSYAVVGPGTIDPNTGVTGMYMGGRDKTGDSTLQNPGKRNQNPLHVVMWNGGPFTAGVFSSLTTSPGVGQGAYLAQAANIKPVVGVPLATNLFTVPANSATVAQILPQNGRATAVWTQRFSLSEPESGYPVWPTPMPAQDDSFFYQDVPVAGTKWPNIPWDSPNAVAFQGTNAGQTAPNPNIAPNGSAVGTVAGYTTVYLQRLANPLAVWDSYANPYITVDSMDVHLTSYTGEASPPSGGATGGVEKAYAGVVGAPTVVAFNNVHRGMLGVGGPDFPNVWTPIAHGTAPAPTGGTLAAPLLFGLPGGSSLGYINAEYCVGGLWATGMYNAATLAPAVTATTGINPPNYYGDPLTPFPWFPWNDRPYVSQYELMLVPASGPSSLLLDMGMLGQNPISANNPMNQYNPGAQAPLGSLPFAQFRHFLNFFDDVAPGGATITNEIPRLYRVFDYIHVPSRFAGTQSMLDPAQFAGTTAGPHAFHPPFNWLSQYREPGRVNLNTVFDPQVFQGVMDDYPGWATLWGNVVAARRGYAAGSIYTFNPAYPTIFANPSRAAGTSTLVPLASMMPVNAAGTLQDVNGTMLRANASLPGGTPGGPTAMLDANSFDTTNQGANEVAPPVGNPNYPNLYRNAGRNPYFEYAPETRLGNLTTNHSNVYAIWITLGKFAVTQGRATPTHPDGYYLSPNGEIVNATGDYDRPKAFYIFDRSIPVGFIRGENLNVEKGTLIGGVLKN